MCTDRRKMIALVALGILANSPLARAASLQCTTAERSSWLPPAVIKKMLQEHGFGNIGAIQVNDGSCYVVQATDQTGTKKTLYLSPADGALMAME